MTLRLRLALLFSVLVTVILIVINLIIIISYSDFRRSEFYGRLEERARTTARLMIDVKEIDHDLLRLIDKNTINALYEEKVLIFDKADQLIYSSIDEHTITYHPELISKVRKKKRIEYNENESEVLGILYNESSEGYVILASAFDKYGKRKLNNLLYTLAASIVVGLLLTAIAAYYFVKQSLKPIETLNFKISAVTESNLQEKFDFKEGPDEISKLAKNFKDMLERLSNAFEMQRSFVQHASHELRTPLATLTSQIENISKKQLTETQYKELLVSLREDLDKLTRILNSLLFLSRFNVKMEMEFTVLHLHELIIKSIETVKEHLPAAKIYFNLDLDFENEDLLRVKGNETMLLVAFTNLIENACKYSYDDTADILVRSIDNNLEIWISNNGGLLSEKDKKNIFQPFFRGENSYKKRGFGLGLSIVKRILDVHSAAIYYTDQNHKNNFIVSLSKF